MVKYKNTIVQDDLAQICRCGLNWKAFDNKTVLITGATGMLAEYLAFTLLYLRENCDVRVNVIALCRTRHHAEEVYSEFLAKDYFSILSQDVCEPIDYNGSIDYIFHLAGNASPYSINNDPVGILKANLLGTFNVMELAREKSVQRVLFVSTREVYGASSEQQLSETSFGRLDPMDNRSCYPESKRAAETILRSYFLQYGIESVLARVAHSYGPGMKIHNDGRVMADFIGDAVDGKDIVLHSSGEAVRSFLYLSDAVVGLFTILLQGVGGEAYNLSNELEPMPIYKVAELICSLLPEKNIHVVFSNEKPKGGYCNYPRVALDNTKIERLGFIPKVSLSDGLYRTLNSFK